MGGRRAGRPRALVWGARAPVFLDLASQCGAPFSEAYGCSEVCGCAPEVSSERAAAKWVATGG
eukprot:1462267-Alexandrium_andersonii.AAC.1